MLGVSVALAKLFLNMTGKQVGKKRGYMMDAVVAFGPIMLLLAQSLGSIVH